MAAGQLPRPGSEFGPCLTEECGHIDCGQTREMAKQECRYCRKPIGYDRRFYILPSEQNATRGELVHATCHEDAIVTEQEKQILAEILNEGAIKQ